MKRYSFTLEVVGISAKDDRYEDVLFEAGCDDALISVVDGKLWGDFDREAASYEEAVQSGAADIARAGGREGSAATASIQTQKEPHAGRDSIWSDQRGSGTGSGSLLSSQ